MPSFDIVNYSLRPNKSIQRALVFEHMKLLSEQVDLKKLLYVGLGSVWFTDFALAHKQLRVSDMISIEGDEIGFARANFNKPFKTVEVKFGLTSQVIPVLLDEENLTARPWMIWLDFDSALSEAIVEDVQRLVERAPPNSILLTTVNAVAHKYGRPKDRPKRLKDLLGDVVPDELDRLACEDDTLPVTLAGLLLDYMQSVAANASRPGGFVPAFRMSYRDGAAMTTVGGVLPQKGAVSTVKALVKSTDWTAVVANMILTPLLTMKEASALQAELPRKTQVSRARVKQLGFDLDERQIEAYQRYYRLYPNYAQIVT